METQGKSTDPKVATGASAASYRVVISSLGTEFHCRADQSILAAMIATGKRPLAVGCRSGGCGVCRIEVIEGQYRTGFMSRSVITAADEASGLILACRTFPVGDMVIEPKLLKKRMVVTTMDVAA